MKCAGKRQIAANLWLLAAAGVALAASPTQDGQDPLPERSAFLEEVRKNLRSNRELLSQYTFIQARETRYLDKKGGVKKTERKVWEIFPGGESGETFRRLVSQDGQPVSRKKREKQDRSWERERQKMESESGRKRLAKERLQEEEAIAEAFRLYRFDLEARETVDGYPVIRVRFEPQPDYRPRLKEVRQLKKIRGVAWVHEPDHQLVRLEAELIEPISVGWGLLAKLRKGARLEFSRRLINGEIWLPSESTVRAAARVLFKGLRLESIDTYSDFQKFSVESSVRFEPR